MVDPLLATGVEDAISTMAKDILGALPRILSGLLFLIIAAVLIKTVVWALSVTLQGTMRGESPIYRQFVVTVVSVFLWFGALLSLLSVVGLDGIAASLGTATGFVALGVAYALSDMIADVVGGIYLLRDPDFEPGDIVEVDDLTGEVRSIELRKTRFAVDDDVVVMANSDIENEWRKTSDGGAAADPDEEPVGGA